jgi:HTH-type transcriptional regulator/antitoxin HigA
LWGAKSRTPEGDRLDVLATLIDAYEAHHYPMDPPDPIEAIKFRMEQQGLTRRDLEPLIGTRTRVAEVLNRKRSLSIGMIRRLHRKLGISAEVLIRPSGKDRAA